ncbi:MAG: cupin domain-containing protein [Planctomycetes bacterium]|nr:cupin domain-containing protein [Planctomycetota bacterium]
MTSHLLVRTGALIPVPGGKRIEELFGRVHTRTDEFSLARMTAPPGWSEPAQTPEFDELTIVLAGRLRCEIDGELVEVAAGENLWVRPGTTVRYGNPYGEPAEYLALCWPAFTVERAGRAAD